MPIMRRALSAQKIISHGVLSSSVLQNFKEELADTWDPDTVFDYLLQCKDLEVALPYVSREKFRDIDGETFLELNAADLIGKGFQRYHCRKTLRIICRVAAKVKQRRAGSDGIVAANDAGLSVDEDVERRMVGLNLTSRDSVEVVAADRLSLGIAPMLSPLPKQEPLDHPGSDAFQVPDCVAVLEARSEDLTPGENRCKLYMNDNSSSVCKAVHGSQGLCTMILPDNANRNSSAVGQSKSSDLAIPTHGARLSSTPSRSNSTGQRVTVSNEIKRWKKGEMIGSGAFGKVFIGLNEETGEFIAVKQVKFSDMAELRAFRQEINLMSSLNHENIVRYLGTQRVDDTLCIFTEWVPGGSILGLLKRFGKLSESVVRKYLKQILAGLVYLHEEGSLSLSICDRNIDVVQFNAHIKPANILVDDRGSIKLGDFGASRKMNAQILGVDHEIAGSPFFMAPEVVRQAGHDEKADVWSLGGTVLQMVTGEPPWKGVKNSDTTIALMYRIATAKDPPPISPLVSPPLRQFLLACFERSPASRPSARDLLSHPFIVSEDQTWTLKKAPRRQYLKLDAATSPAVAAGGGVDVELHVSDDMFLAETKWDGKVGAVASAGIVGSSGSKLEHISSQRGRGDSSDSDGDEESSGTSSAEAELLTAEDEQGLRGLVLSPCMRQRSAGPSTDLAATVAVVTTAAEADDEEKDDTHAAAVIAAATADLLKVKKRRASLLKAAMDAVEFGVGESMASAVGDHKDEAGYPVVTAVAAVQAISKGFAAASADAAELTGAAERNCSSADSDILRGGRDIEYNHTAAMVAYANVTASLPVKSVIDCEGESNLLQSFDKSISGRSAAGRTTVKAFLREQARRCMSLKNLAASYWQSGPLNYPTTPVGRDTAALALSPGRRSSASGSSAGVGVDVSSDGPDNYQPGIGDGAQPTKEGPSVGELSRRDTAIRYLVTLSESTAAGSDSCCDVSAEHFDARGSDGDSLDPVRRRRSLPTSADVSPQTPSGESLPRCGTAFAPRSLTPLGKSSAVAASFRGDSDGLLALDTSPLGGGTVVRLLPIQKNPADCGSRFQSTAIHIANPSDLIAAATPPSVLVPVVAAASATSISGHTKAYNEAVAEYRKAQQNRPGSGTYDGAAIAQDACTTNPRAGLVPPAGGKTGRRKSHDLPKRAASRDTEVSLGANPFSTAGRYALRRPESILRMEMARDLNSYEEVLISTNDATAVPVTIASIDDASIGLNDGRGRAASSARSKKDHRPGLEPIMSPSETVLPFSLPLLAEPPVAHTTQPVHCSPPISSHAAKPMNKPRTSPPLSPLSVSDVGGRLCSTSSQQCSSGPLAQTILLLPTTRMLPQAHETAAFKVDCDQDASGIALTIKSRMPTGNDSDGNIGGGFSGSGTDSEFCVRELSMSHSADGDDARNFAVKAADSAIFSTLAAGVTASCLISKSHTDTLNADRSEVEVGRNDFSSPSTADRLIRLRRLPSKERNSEFEPLPISNSTGT